MAMTKRILTRLQLTARLKLADAYEKEGRPVRAQQLRNRLFEELNHEDKVAIGVIVDLLYYRG